MKNTVYLSLGSNIQPEKNFPAAIKLLAIHSRLQAVSSVWETRPVGTPNQPNFLNGAAIIETELTAAALKWQVCRRIEAQLGRIRTEDKHGPRPIDIDIMLFNRDIFELDQQHIPSEEILTRAFVAIPLAEIAPTYRHPETGQTLATIAEGFTPSPQSMWLRPDIFERLKDSIQ